MLLKVIDAFFWIYMIMLFIRVLASWLPELQDTRFMAFISFYTDPYLNLFRRLIPPIGMIDISPMIAFLFIGYFIEPLVKVLAKFLITLF